MTTESVIDFKREAIASMGENYSSRLLSGIEDAMRSIAARVEEETIERCFLFASLLGSTDPHLVTRFYAPKKEATE